jgi:KDO2-lipid IV(A) lauroyltransferase
MKRTALQRWLIDPLEYALVRLLFGGLGLLSPVRASNLGAWVGRTLGPRLPASNRARRNLTLAMPELSPAEHEAIIRQMWDNLGRIFGEIPHLGVISATVAVPPEQLAALKQAKADGRPLIFVGAHLSNFEVFGRASANHGYPLALIYRRANNPLVDDYYRQLRGRDLLLLPKGLEGFREVRKVMAAGGNLGILIDQKLNEGVAVPFFNRPAMTTAAPAQMAMRFRAPIILGHAERLGPASYRLFASVVPEITPAEASTKGRREAELAMTIRLNELVEAQIRKQPGDWFWLHRRWPDSKGPWPDPALVAKAAGANDADRSTP